MIIGGGMHPAVKHTPAKKIINATIFILMVFYLLFVKFLDLDTN